MRFIALALVVAALVVDAAACSKLESAAPMVSRSAAKDAEAPAPPPPPPAGAALEADMPAASANMAFAGGAAPKPVMMAAKSEKKSAAMHHEVDESAKEVPPNAAPMRAWFPETFLFAPRVITKDDGTANVDVTVPDRLTTWRVLALAHSRKGAQAGALTTLQSQLPVSVDVVVPAFLVAGDRVALPVQVTNTTDKAIASAVALKLEGAGSISGASTLNARVDAQSTSTETAWLDAIEPGSIGVQADAGSDDSVRRTIAVKSNGRPRHAEASGTLASKRTFSVALEPGALDHSANVSLHVFPGALAILRSEIAAAPDRESVDDDGYLVALAARAKAVSTKLGAPVDDKTLAHLERIAAQRVARRAVSPDPSTAAVLAPGALAFPADTLLGRNGDHLAALVARSQRPDGTFGGGNGWPLSRVLVTTAQGVAAVRAPNAHGDAKSDGDVQRRAQAVTLKARGAFERFGAQVDDAYTAAVIVASGAVDGAVADSLREKVRAAIVDDGAGKKSLVPASSALRPDGSHPSTIEATAFAILALHDDAKASALLPDLGATVISAYRPGLGFGDGATNRAAFDAVTLLFAEPLPSKVALALTVDGTKIGSTTLEGEALHDVATVTSTLAKAGAALEVVVEADPPLPGLSYVLAVDYAVPWPKPTADAGLSLDVKVKGALAVGKPADVEVRATAPGGSPIHVVQGLPAGIDPVRSSLDALVSSGVLSKYDVTDGVVTLDAPARRQGELFDATFKVVPTLAGSLHARVASLSLPSSPTNEVFFPPSTWTVAK